MADKKANDILEEQRRAREEFLKLKKMQQGELEAGPKPSEVAVAPKTAKEKAQNFWFHNKWQTIGVIFLVITLTILIAQCASKPKYDLEIVYFTYSPVLDAQLEGATEYFEKISPDVNGDGEVKISLVNCSMSDKQADTQYRNTIYTKIQALLIADEKAMLFITDGKSDAYFDNISSDAKLFEKTVELGEEFYKESSSQEYGELPSGLKISCRVLSDSMMADSKDAKNSHKAAMDILEKLKTKE